MLAWDIFVFLNLCFCVFFYEICTVQTMMGWVWTGSKWWSTTYASLTERVIPGYVRYQQKYTARDQQWQWLDFKHLSVSYRVVERGGLKQIYPSVHRKSYCKSSVQIWSRWPGANRGTSDWAQIAHGTKQNDTQCNLNYVLTSFECLKRDKNHRNTLHITI